MIYNLDQCNFDYELVLVDGGSSDGTLEAVRLMFDNVEVISAPNKYWAQCVTIGFSTISSRITKHDFLLIFNDDIQVFQSFSVDLKRYIDKRSQDNILVMPFCDPVTKQATYGGLKKSKSLYPLRFERVPVSSGLASCDTLNMNCCIIPGKITFDIEIFPSNFIHNSADIHFGLQLTSRGYTIIQNDRYVGYCNRNSFVGTSQERGIGPLRRIMRSLSVKEQPIWQRYYFMRSNGGRLWIVWWLFYYIKKLFK